MEPVHFGVLKFYPNFKSYCFMGIDYKDDGNRFFGSTLFYDYEKSTILVGGDENHPCYYNDLLISGAESNLETGNVKTQILGGGM